MGNFGYLVGDVIPWVLSRGYVGLSRGDLMGYLVGDDFSYLVGNTRISRGGYPVGVNFRLSRGCYPVGNILMLSRGCYPVDNK